MYNWTCYGFHVWEKSSNKKSQHHLQVYVDEKKYKLDAVVI